MNQQTEIRAQYAPWTCAIQLLVRRGNSVVTDMVFTEPKEGQHTTPTLTIDTNAGQLLMDDLWACGLRPTEGKGSAGALAATERHLKDLQRLVFQIKQTEEWVTTNT